LGEVLDRIGTPPKVFILLLREVPMIDATGVRALQDFVSRAQRTQTQVILAELQSSVAVTLEKMGILDSGVTVSPSYDAAIRQLSAASA
jgi:SulP family sulfate permease